MPCDICKQTVGKSAYSHSRTARHFMMLKKRMARVKALAELNGYYEYPSITKKLALIQE